MKLLLLFSGSFLLTFGLFAQDRCATKVFEAYQAQKNPLYAEAKEAFLKNFNALIKKKNTGRMLPSEEKIYKIPVVVHIIHNNASETIGGTHNTNISDEQVYSQIRVLNEDYRRKPFTNGFNNDPLGADTKIEFCLASRDPNGKSTTGITRTYSPKNEWRVTDDSLMKTLQYWPASQYLNIWVLNLEPTYLGYSQFPYSKILKGLVGPYDINTDGVVIDYTAFGTMGAARPPYNLGRTATHEIGHWLGLIHIWGDAHCGNDYVSDTPWDYWYNDSGTCKDSSDCDLDGVYTRDLTNDYLDYSVDACMNLFTSGQKQRMRTLLETSPLRKAVTLSPGCCPPADAALAPIVESFENNNFPTQGWEIHSPGAFTYTLTSPGAFDRSNHALKITSAGGFSGDTTANKNYIFLSTPFVSMQHSFMPSLTFDLAYSLGLTSVSDSLVISYQTGCGLWSPVYTLSGTEIITAAGNNKSFSPSPSQWKHFEFPLNEITNTLGKIRIEIYSKSGNNLYLDNISILESSPYIQAIPYPNPSADETTVRVLFLGEKDITVNLYSSFGQSILNTAIKKTPSFSFPIDLKHLASGVYFFKATDGKQTALSKIVVVH